MKFRWVNNCTGEVYRNLVHAITTIVSDLIHYKACREDWKEMWNISRL